jgi:hypothetical protein
MPYRAQVSELGNVGIFNEILAPIYLQMDYFHISAFNLLDNYTRTSILGLSFQIRVQPEAQFQPLLITSRGACATILGRR